MNPTFSPGNERLKDYLQSPDHLIMMYVGNLESYQGIDLLLESVALASQKSFNFELFIIGGDPADVEHYTQVSSRLALGKRVHFLGQRPVNLLSYYLAQADILVSPRIKGKNTPMKVYSYLGSGKAVIATNLETHTQVLTPEISMLVEPDPISFSEGLLALVENPALRASLGQAAKRMIDENFSLEAFKRRANTLLDWVQERTLLSAV